MSGMLEVQGLFDQLADALVALKEAHADDPETFTHIESAEQLARRGAELAANGAGVLKN